MSDMNLLTVKQVSELLTCSTSYVWKLLRCDPSFPKPIQLGVGESRPRSTRWVEGAVSQWLLAKHEEANPLTNSKVLTNEHGRTGRELHKAPGEEVAA
jgi:predicted DNA-binding transcriptional regulator AlpA